MGFDWHRRDHGEMLDHSRRLSAKEAGYFNALIDLYCQRQGDVPDVDREVASFLNKDIREWRGIKRHLIKRGLIAVEEGRLFIEIANRELHQGLKRMQDGARAGRASGAARKEISRSYPLARPQLSDSYANKSGFEPSLSNDLGSTVVQRPPEPITLTKEEESRAQRRRRPTSIGDSLRSSDNPTLRAAMRGKERDANPA